MLHRAIDTLHRREGAFIMAGLIRRLGSLEVAEEALQDAYAKALQRWPVEGMPANPAGWLTRVARNRGIDLLRHDGKSFPDSELLLAGLAANEPDPPENSALPDDRLSLIFTCCHPALAPSAQTALALRLLCQLTTSEIARAFVESEATTAQKIVRAKRKIAAARIAYEVPSESDLPERLAAVLAVIYLVFNEGYSATAHERLTRPDLVSEAIRLGQLLVTLLPSEPEAKGLLALMLLHDARSATRESADGILIPLEMQDRAGWDKARISEGITQLDAALLARRPGPYQIQAAIAALHASAPSAVETDWSQISALYGALLRHLNTPVVQLNAAVSQAMSGNIPASLAWMERIEAQGALASYHLLHAAKADLHRRQGNLIAARDCYLKALELVRNSGERKYIEQRLNELKASEGQLAG